MDKDGYPTKKELYFIRRFDSLKRPAKELIDFIESIWWAKEWGFHFRKTRDEYASVMTIGEKPKHRYHYVLELHTGGWSGNEDVIRALEQNKWFYNFFWQSSRVGGHYEFRIPEHDYERKEK